MGCDVPECHSSGLPMFAGYGNCFCGGPTGSGKRNDYDGVRNPGLVSSTTDAGKNYARSLSG